MDFFLLIIWDGRSISIDKCIKFISVKKKINTFQMIVYLNFSVKLIIHKLKTFVTKIKKLKTLRKKK